MVVWRVAFFLLLVFGFLTLRLFVVPGRDEPTKADAILVLGGWGDRLGKGTDLAKRGYAPVLLVSLPYQGCPDLTEVEVVCFRPVPFTTQGEARYAAELAAAHHWRHLIVVTSTDQTTRGRLRLQRCTDLTLTVVSAPLPHDKWPFAIAYQW